MNTSHTSQSKRSLKALIPGAIAALALFGSAHVHAMGDATDAELPWVRPSVDAPLHGSQPMRSTTAERSSVMKPQVAERAQRSTPTGDAYANEWLPVTASVASSDANASSTRGAAAAAGAASPAAGVSRADVRESLKTWRAAGLLTPQSEIGDTTETLQRREEFYALQTEVIQAEQMAAVARAEEESLAQAQLQLQLQLQSQLEAESAASANTAAMLEPSADGQLMVVPPTATGTISGDDAPVIVEVVEIDE
jgi:hypothetical protein